VPFARPFVNSGRLSTAVALPESPLNTPDADDWAGGGVAPGWPALDAPLGEGWLLERLGRGFVLLADRDPGIAGVETIVAGEEDELLRERYALAPGAIYLIRPDSYVCARWHAPDEAAVRAALLRAKGN
jgi:3-(3-hydroxy-phenyl)propionate hydroxylase